MIEQHNLSRNLINLFFSTYIITLKLINDYYNIINFIFISFLTYFILDIFDMDFVFIIHHMLGIIINLLQLTSNYIYLDLVNIFLNFEVSTIYLNLYFLTKSIYWQVIFALNFLYFRIYKYYHFMIYELDFNKIDNVCNSNSIFNYTLCKNIVYLEIILFGIVNTYWAIYILKKAFINTLCDKILYYLK